MKEYDVIIIGGGITGAGMARDCAMRGLKTLLVERFDLTNGATGRNHGLLHSGARYAVNDAESARECIIENKILCNIAPFCVEKTGGLFINLPGDDDSYRKDLIKSCQELGIDAEEISPEEALSIEPSINPMLTAALKVPDASIDPFVLTSSNVLDASIHGAEILTYVEVRSLIISRDRVVGISLINTFTGEQSDKYASIIVNAAGIWSAKIAAMAGINIKMIPSKGSLLIFGRRVNHMVINRCRKPSDADILVPGGVVSILGTTSSKVSFEECDDIRISSNEVETLLSQGSMLAPELLQTRVLRAYAGVRPLVSSDDDPTGRSVSRGIVLLDHQKRDGLSGFITITGGKLTCYRLMAQQATDLVCAKLGINKACYTAKQPLPGFKKNKKTQKSDSKGRFSTAGHRNLRRSNLSFADKSEVLCSCEHVTRAEIEYAVKYLGVKNLIDLRRHTRIGMGSCQGAFCMAKIANVLAEILGIPERADEFVKQYVAERWKGITPVCWGETIREMELMRKKYGR